MQANNCMSLVVLTVSLWISEAIPYFATALLVPPLVVFLGNLYIFMCSNPLTISLLLIIFVLFHRIFTFHDTHRFIFSYSYTFISTDVLKDPSNPGHSMSTDDASQFVLSHIFNHMTFLLLGGYTISAAFSRCRLELAFASYLQQKLGNRPNLFILAIMMLGMCMFV